MKKTKIVCSIGPSSNEPDVMEQMVRSGMNVARINCSHATEEEKAKVITNVKEVRERTGMNVAILYDLKGPEFRSGILKQGEITLVPGKNIRLLNECLEGDENGFTVNHPEVLASLSIGDKVLLENGLMSLEVISKETDGLTCKIVEGGVLGNKKSMSVPNVQLNLPFISEQDFEDIKYGCSTEIDYIALSFVSTKENVLEVKELLKKYDREDIKLICKIENQAGIDNIEEILSVSYGAMVARGDLGTETSMEILPMVQKDIIRKCREQGKVCIVATEMLESMKTNSRPTRAEISDVANAVLDGTDAVMLSGESTVGKYPVETVQFMANICETTEQQTSHYIDFNYKKRIGITQTIANCVINSAEMLNAKLIVAATVSGFSARKISNLKPNCPILAACPTPEIARGLALNWGVYPVNVPLLDTTDEVIARSMNEAKDFADLKKGDIVIVTGSFPNTSNAKSTNLLKIEEV